MTALSARGRRPLVRALVALQLAACVLALGARVRADDQPPKPDPAGIATGDRTTAVDGGGNSFMVTEPTDKTAPDFADKQKAFQEFST